MEENNNILGTTIRNARIASGLSQQSLSDVSEVSLAPISKLESGKSIPHPSTLKKLCLALCIDYVEILEKCNYYNYCNCKSSLGHKIKEARIARGYSQNDLSKLTGITQGQIGNIEAGISMPNKTTLQALCIPLSLDFEELSKLSVKDKSN